MADPNFPFGDDDTNKPNESSPFGRFPGPDELGNLIFQIMSGVGGTSMSRSQTVQMAAQIANEGRSESNVDPAVRIKVEMFGRIAEMHVADVSRRSLHGIEIEAVNRTGWIETTVVEFEPFIAVLSDVLGKVAGAEIQSLPEEAFEIPEGLELPPGVSLDAIRAFQQFAPALPQILNTMMTAGLVGQLATRSFGIFDLPLPRPDSKRISIIAPNVERFGTDWELEPDDLLLWITIQELASYVALSAPGLREALDELVISFLQSFESPDEGRLSEFLEESAPGAEIDDPTQAVQNMFADPLALLSAIQSPAQRALRPEIDRLVGIAVAYIDWIVDRVTERVLPNCAMIAEALRRRRLEVDAASQFVERLFGLELSTANLDHGRAFVRGVVDRGGQDALDSLLDVRENLPTKTEYEAPGLWLARLGFDIDDQAIEAQLEGFEIPDYFDPDEI